jgi:outer membrane usher protein
VFSAAASAVDVDDAADDMPELIATYARNGGAGLGTDYRLSAASSGDYDARWRRRFSAIEWELQAARNGGRDLLTAGASGAATLMGGEWRAARSIGGSFALVDAGGLPNVPVYLENQLVAYTDARGQALLGDLRPFELNRIGIDPAELPLDTSIGTPELLIAPAGRGGVVAHLDIRRIRGGTFRLVREDGRAVPSGAWVMFNGERFRVALDGLVYVTNFDHGLSAIATWSDGSCRFRIEPPPAHDPQPDMGTLRCRATAPPTLQVGEPRPGARR